MSKNIKKSGEDSSSPDFKNNKKEVDKLLGRLKNKLDKEFKDDKDSEGDGLVSASEALIPADPIPTGFPSFDAATGIGGLPDNGVVEVSGDEGMGKTWIALKVIASAQKIDPRRCVLWDLEGSSDPSRLLYCGIDLDELLMPPPTLTGEKLFETTETMIESGAISTIVIDSIPALQPKKIFEGEIGDQHYGPIAALLSDALRKIAPKCRKHKVLLILINQVRDNVGGGMFEPKTVTTGGRAIKFYSHMRIQLKRPYEAKDKVKPQIIDSTGELIGHRVKSVFIKNRYAPPYKEGIYEVYYKDPDIIHEVISMAKKAKLWRIYKGDYIYVDINENKIIASNEEDFRRRLMMNSLVTEMAERILLKQAQGELEEEILDPEFSIDNLEKTEKESFVKLSTGSSENDNSEEE